LRSKWRLTLHPVIRGDGLSLFGPREKHTRLELRASKTFMTGIIAAHYLTKR